MAKTKILFIGFQDLVHPCYDDFLEAIGAEYDVSLFDPHVPVADQIITERSRRLVSLRREPTEPANHGLLQTTMDRGADGGV